MNDLHPHDKPPNNISDLANLGYDLGLKMVSIPSQGGCQDPYGLARYNYHEQHLFRGLPKMEGVYDCDSGFSSPKETWAKQ